MPVYPIGLLQAEEVRNGACRDGPLRLNLGPGQRLTRELLDRNVHRGRLGRIAVQPGPAVDWLGGRSMRGAGHVPLH